MASVDRNNPQRAASSESSYSLMEFMADFPDDATCLDWLFKTRFAEDGKHAFCDKCGETRTFHRVASRPLFSCAKCGFAIHPTAGTIYHKSSTSLHLWFYAMYLITSTRCGISAKQLERELGVTYKTAWRMFNLIRNDLMEQDDEPLASEVEVDEMYMGGRRKPGAKRGRPDKVDRRKKVAVVGMVERSGGRVYASTVPDTGKITLQSHVRKYVMPESTIFTDDYVSYRGLDRDGFTHHRINHSEGIYVMGNVHTNTIEGFWSLVKNGIRGTYHSVSRKRLQGYLNEYAWRYNARSDGKVMFLTLLLRAARP